MQAELIGASLTKFGARPQNYLFKRKHLRS
jgi:hypothetical protein